ncbi:hypothetical protein QFZ77_007539 [Paenibacillus sp. V4I3]|nr:hypothetical protein [Paenibacillus sp. V4I3]
MVKSSLRASKAISIFRLFYNLATFRIESKILHDYDGIVWDIDQWSVLNKKM